MSATKESTGYNFPQGWIMQDATNSHDSNLCAGPILRIAELYAACMHGGIVSRSGQMDCLFNDAAEWVTVGVFAARIGLLCAGNQTSKRV